MLLNLPIRNAGMKWLIVFLLLIFPLSGTVFGQTSALVLDSTDIRVEYSLYNDVSGFNVFIRKKPGIESVMLTEPSGAHALRATAWNPVNGNERRAISGVMITGAYSQYSIVSSTPQPDEQFGSAFHLFIPSVVVYGNPTSPTGTVYYNVNTASQINIRTFDQKYADPNRSRFQNNHYKIRDLLVYPMLIPPPLPPPDPDFFPAPEPVPYANFVKQRDLNEINRVRNYLKQLLGRNEFLDSLDDKNLEKFLISTFRRENNEQQTRR